MEYFVRLAGCVPDKRWFYVVYIDLPQRATIWQFLNYRTFLKSVRWGSPSWKDYCEEQPATSLSSMSSSPLRAIVLLKVNTPKRFFYTLRPYGLLLYSSCLLHVRQVPANLADYSTCRAALRTLFMYLYTSHYIWPVGELSCVVSCEHMLTLHHSLLSDIWMQTLLNAGKVTLFVQLVSSKLHKDPHPFVRAESLDSLLRLHRRGSFGFVGAFCFFFFVFYVRCCVTDTLGNYFVGILLDVQLFQTAQSAVVGSNVYT